MQRGVKTHGLAGYHVIPASGAMPLEDNAFDAGWCNSVIEHVTLPAAELGRVTHEDFFRRARIHQHAFAGEIRRIGRQWFVQVPHQHSPIEAHAWFPFVQYLPQPLRYRLSKVMHPLWIKQWAADFELYDKARLQEDFPDATAYFDELSCGLVKSLIAWRATG